MFLDLETLPKKFIEYIVPIYFRVETHGILLDTIYSSSHLYPIYKEEDKNICMNIFAQIIKHIEDQNILYSNIFLYRKNDCFMKIEQHKNAGYFVHFIITGDFDFPTNEEIINWLTTVMEKVINPLFLENYYQESMPNGRIGLVFQLNPKDITKKDSIAIDYFGISNKQLSLVDRFLYHNELTKENLEEIQIGYNWTMKKIFDFFNKNFLHNNFYNGQDILNFFVLLQNEKLFDETTNSIGRKFINVYSPILYNDTKMFSITIEQNNVGLYDLKIKEKQKNPT